MAPLTEHEIKQRHAWMAVALRDMPNLDDVLDRVCAQAHEANDLRAALDRALGAWERYLEEHHRRDPHWPPYEQIAAEIAQLRKEFGL